MPFRSAYEGVRTDSPGRDVAASAVLEEQGLLRILDSSFGTLATFGACCGARRAAVQQRDDGLAVTESHTREETYEKLWKSPSMSARKRRPQRSQPDDTISLSFGHAASTKHWGAVQALAVCPQTRDLYTGSRDFRIKRWVVPDRAAAAADAAAAAPPQPTHHTTLAMHSGWVTALAVTRFFLISASYDTTVRLWHLQSSRHCHTFHDHHSDYVLALASADSAARFVSAGLRGHLNFWDLETCVRIVRARREGSDQYGKLPAPVLVGGEVASGSIYAVHVTPDGRLAAFNGQDGCIRIYDERAGTSKVATLGERSRSAPWERVRCLRWARDGGRLVSGGGGNALRLWDVRQRATVHEWRAHEDTVWAVHGDENLRTVYSGGRDGRVFRVDTTTTEASLITHRPQPVLALQPDTFRDVLWVSTANSSVHAWPLDAPDARADPPTSADKPSTNTASDHTDATPHADAAAHGERQESGASASTAPPRPPAFTISGHAPLVRCAVFDDRRHVLTRDLDGRVGLWDVVRGKHVKHYEPGADFEAVFRQLFVSFLVTVNSWFQIDISQGVITLRLDEVKSFGAEVYAHTVGVDAADDVKYIYACQLLQAVLEGMRARFMGRTDVDAYARKGPFAYQRDRAVDPIVSASYPRSALRWRKPMRALDGSEVPRQLLPPWVENLILKGTCPRWPDGVLRSKGFTIAPAECMAERLPVHPPERLTAPVILEIRKVANYVINKMHAAGITACAAEITFDAAENARLAAKRAADSGPLVAIVHKGALLPSCLSLSTVSRYLDDGKNEDDIDLEYLVLDWAESLPIADVVPKEIPID